MVYYLYCGCYCDLRGFDEDDDEIPFHFQTIISAPFVLLLGICGSALNIEIVQTDRHAIQ